MRLFRSLKTATGFWMLAAALSGCGVDVVDCICTEEFRVYWLTAVDGAGNPVPDVVVTRENLRTGEILEPTWLGLLTPGTYTIVDDGMLDAFSSAGDVVRVTGVKGDIGFTASFLFATPEPCRCHVERVSGPDTVVVGPIP